MGLSRLTYLIIQGNDVEAIAFKVGDKWGGGIVHGPNHHAGMPLCETSPQYNSEAEALLAMNNIIKEIKENEN